MLELTTALRDLLETPAETRADLKAWYERAHELTEAIPPALSNRIPHFVWHFLSDADIRARDKESSEIQVATLRMVLEQMEAHEPPP